MITTFKRIKRLVINLTVLFLSLFLSIFVAELLFRVFSNKSPLTIHHPKLFCEYDPVLGWKLSPNTTGMHNTTEYSVSESFNSKGIRGPEYSYNKNDDEYRILILGDSFAEGYSVEFNELLSEVLKRKLNNKGTRYYEVINMGTGGYSTDQEFSLFQIEGKKYRPDITILMFYENDVWYNNQPKHWRGYKPIFKLEEGKLRLTNVPVPKPDKVSNQTQYVTTRKSFYHFFEKIKEWLSRKSYLYCFTRDRIKNTHYLYSLAIKVGLVAKNKANKASLIPDEFRVWEIIYCPKIRNAWNITEAIIIKLKEETDSVDSKLLVFYIPSRASICVDEWKAIKRKYGIADENWNIEQVSIELEAICKRYNIDFLNPSKLFKARNKELKIQGKQLYFIKDGHWNVHGHKLVGEILAKYISLSCL